MTGRFAGAGVGVLSAAALGAAMLPLRSHLSIATSALVLVLPVVAGVVVGGFVAGLVSVAAGFVVYDFAFIPPYWTLSVGSAQHWVALFVYIAVMVLVARVVASLDEARAASRAREKNVRYLFELSESLLGDRAVPDLSRAIVEDVRTVFNLRGAALLMPTEGHLEIVASSGEPTSETEMGQLSASAQLPVALSTLTSTEPVQTLALVAAGRPVGLLVLRGLPDERSARELLPVLANHLALALERAQLSERVRRVELLEEIERLRQALVGAVSHDLRTPLSTIKLASSTLLESSTALSSTDAKELLELIDLQADRLTRLVQNLLDMTRIEAGVLEVRHVPCWLGDLVNGAVDLLGHVLDGHEIRVDLPSSMPMIEVDPALTTQVLCNLLDNAQRHAPTGTPITVAAKVLATGSVAVSVSDQGGGVPPAERDYLFDTFVRFDTGGRAGLGLAIARSFAEAHGEHLWLESPDEGGARFVFSVPVAAAREMAD